ncbi:MAG: Mrp/NBP35 family ATP-binding protein [Lachnospiraceae bacterium]|nr:Mrp/NBP35 family ATP-binding protein [Lachnospiraceae bacterium]
MSENEKKGMSFEEAKRKHEQETSFAPKPGTRVKRVIAVVSGKGGVGKSLVTGLSAVAARRNGFRVAILDADITGPSIPKMFGVTPYDVKGDETAIYPAETSTGIKVVSMNLLMEDPNAPVLWRSPLITGALRQFWTDFTWGDVDYMFIDMPPGTGDVPLTVYQSLPLDGIIVVTSPQDLVSMIVEKAVGMAKLMGKPVLGIVENMSYVECPHCGEHIAVFGESHVEEIAAKEGLKVIAKLPINPDYAAFADRGQFEYVDTAAISGIMEALPAIEE